MEVYTTTFVDEILNSITMSQLKSILTLILLMGLFTSCTQEETFEPVTQPTVEQQLLADTEAALSNPNWKDIEVDLTAKDTCVFERASYGYSIMGNVMSVYRISSSSSWELIGRSQITWQMASHYCGAYQ